ncbi:TonB-dependent receptor plug domain-containing protein [Luteimonas sp. R10]|uniref:TonB-dependent receptor plug domain-containing protein n=1 Tax=Luteimonas sp. R10 TaxID=3108176 RepID=UPI00308C5BE6|nr:TonB-dependent receptor [Luteimonas sp. R10]
MYQRHRTKRNRLSIALSAVLVVPAAPMAFAQEQAEPANQAPVRDAETDGATELDKVVVTGSRIARDTFNSPSPVQVINREETTLTEFNSTAGVLQSNAITGGSAQINNSFGTLVVDGGGGVNTLSLRGLGATRTLLLLNGRRVAPAGSRGAVGSADLNVLPNILIDRVEILKDGASSIYGSDAVAGVVNIITRQKVDSPVVEFQHNATQHGGGDETRWSVMGGASGDDWWVSGSLELYHRSEMAVGDRDWASGCPRPLFGLDEATGEYGADDPIDPATGKPKCWTIDDNGVTMNLIGTPNGVGVPGPGSLGYYGTNFPGEDSGLPPGMDRFNRWRPNPAVAEGDFPGYEGVDYYGRDAFEPRLLNKSLVSPTKNVTGFLQGAKALDALGEAELYFEVLAHRRESSQTGYRQLTLDYPVNSPLLPAMFDGLPRYSAPPGNGATNGQDVAVRAFIGFGNYRAEQIVDFYRATAGLKGFIGKSWNYDFSLSHAESDADYMIESFLTDRYARSLDVVAAGNGFACRDPSGGCVAAPVLNVDTVGGRLPRDWVNYIFRPTWGNTTYDESTINLTVDGPVFDLPHGTAYGAFGAEYRQAEIDDAPAPDSVTGNLYGLTSSQPTRGKDSVREAFAEVELPLLSGVTGVNELTLNVSGRYTHYDSYGGDTTYKIGLLYSPTEWMSLRASNGTSFRAPALFEQFLGATTSTASSSGDPCNDYGSLPQADPVRVNCASEGLPGDFNQNNSIWVETRGGQETGLAAETSKARTAGIILQPNLPEGLGELSFAADYFDIEVENGVKRLAAAETLKLCYSGTAADFQARNGLCNLVTRGAATSTLEVVTGYVNISVDKVRGWDFNLRYVLGVGPGELRATAQVTHFTEQSGKTFPGDPIKNRNGILNSPEYSGQLDLTYQLQDWQLRYGLEWIDGQDSYAFLADGDQDLYDAYKQTYKMYVDDYHLSHLSLKYTGDGWSLTGGVRNLADKEPPRISGRVIDIIGNAPLYSGYDFLGRSFFMNFTKKF